MKEIVLKKGKEFPLKRFHPWVFSGALKTQTKSIEEGDKVKILDSKGNFLGVAHFQDGSIALRVISWEDRAIDVDFWKEKLQKERQSLAYLYRMVFDFVRFGSVELYLPIRNIGCVKKIDKHES